MSTPPIEDNFWAVYAAQRGQVENLHETTQCSCWPPEEQLYFAPQALELMGLPIYTNPYVKKDEAYLISPGSLLMSKGEIAKIENLKTEHLDGEAKDAVVVLPAFESWRDRFEFGWKQWLQVTSAAVWALFVWWLASVL